MRKINPIPVSHRCIRLLSIFILPFLVIVCITGNLLIGQTLEERHTMGNAPAIVSPPENILRYAG